VDVNDAKRGVTAVVPLHSPEAVRELQLEFLRECCVCSSPSRISMSRAADVSGRASRVARVGRGIIARMHRKLRQVRGPLSWEHDGNGTRFVQRCRQRSKSYATDDAGDAAEERSLQAEVARRFSPLAQIILNHETRYAFIKMPCPVGSDNTGNPTLAANSSKITFCSQKPWPGPDV
jgi:hypothetical protein